MFDNKYPYTDFHELNLDWFLAEFKKVTDKVTTLDDTVQEFTTFVTNYFNNLDVQEEINKKLDAMAADGSLSALIQPLFDEYKAQIDEEIDTQNTYINGTLNNQNTKIQTLEGRMDGFSSLTEGSTTGDAELMDLRVAVDGTVYPTAGDAVRSQFTEVHDSIEDYLDDKMVNVPLLFSAASGYYQMNGVFITDASIDAVQISISDEYKAKTYYLSGRSYYGVCPIVFLDSDDAFISGIVVSDNSRPFQNYEFTLPNNTASVLIQAKNTATSSFLLNRAEEVMKVTTDNVTYDGFDITDIFDDMAEKNLQDVSLTFSAATGYIDENGISYTYANIQNAVISVTPGDQYDVTGYSYYGMAPVIFQDASDNFVYGIKFSDNTAAFTGSVTVPANATKMMLQTYNNRETTAALLIGYKYAGLTGASLHDLMENKKITAVGDSITEYNFRAGTNWVMYLENWSGCTIQNLGVSGSGFANGSKYIDRLSSIQADADLIGVALSWNDMSAGIPIGSATDTGTGSVCGYVNDYFDALITAFPITPIIAYCQGPWEIYRHGRPTSDDYIAKFKEICNNHGIPFYEGLYEGCVLRPWNADNREEYYKSDNPDLGNVGVVDNVHPNSKGHLAIARYLNEKFRFNIQQTGMDYNIQ